MAGWLICGSNSLQLVSEMAASQETSAYLLNGNLFCNCYAYRTDSRDDIGGAGNTVSSSIMD